MGHQQPRLLAAKRLAHWLGEGAWFRQLSAIGYKNEYNMAFCPGKAESHCADWHQTNYMQCDKYNHESLFKMAGTRQR